MYYLLCHLKFCLKMALWHHFPKLVDECTLKIISSDLQFHLNSSSQFVVHLMPVFQNPHFPQHKIQNGKIQSSESCQEPLGPLLLLGIAFSLSPLVMRWSCYRATIEHVNTILISVAPLNLYLEEVRKDQFWPWLFDFLINGEVLYPLKAWRRRMTWEKASYWSFFCRK